MIEKTLVLVKPDGINRKLTGEVIKRFEQRGLKIIAMKMIWPTEELARQHYTDDIEKRRGKWVRDALVKFITECPVVAFVLEGIDAIEVVRKICGPTEPKSASVGTIRGDLAHHNYAICDKTKIAIRNIVHASADQTDAEYEIKLWFKENELFSYSTADEYNHYGPKGFN